MNLSEGRWWEAFGTGGFEGEPSLMEGGLTTITQNLINHHSKPDLPSINDSSELTIWLGAELGINPSHILQKSLAVLNPLSRVNEHIMDDADLAGPFVFCFAFAFVLLLVRRLISPSSS